MPYLSWHLILHKINKSSLKKFSIKPHLRLGIPYIMWRNLANPRKQIFHLFHICRGCFSRWHVHKKTTGKLPCESDSFSATCTKPNSSPPDGLVIMSLCGSHPSWLNMNETEYKSVEAENWPWTKIVLTVLFCLLIVITIIGNTLVILSVITTRRLRTVTNLFVMSLAVADWLVGIFVMPPAVLVSSVGEYLILASILEKFATLTEKPSRTRFLSVYSGLWPLGWIFCEIWIRYSILLIYYLRKNSY